MVDSEGGPGDAAEATRAESENRRRHERYDLFAQVRVQSGKTDYVVELANISQSGVLLLLGKLRKPAWVRIDKDVELAIIHPESGDLVPLEGRIVRLQEDARGVGIGVEFSAVTEAAARGLTELLSLARRTPPPLPGRGGSAG